MSFWHKVTHSVSRVVEPLARGAAKVVTPIAQAAGGALAKSIDKVVPGLGTGMGKALSEVSGEVFDHKSLSDLVGDSIHDRQNNDASPLSQIAYMFLNGKNGTGVPNISQGNFDPSGFAGVLANLNTPTADPAQQGKNTATYLANAYPDLNEWERSGTGGTMYAPDMSGQVVNQQNINKQLAASLVSQQQQNAKDISLAKLQSQTQLAVAAMGNQTALNTAGIASQTSRANVSDQLQLGYQNYDLQKYATEANVQKTLADADLSRQQKYNAIANMLQTDAQIKNLSLTGEQIKAQTESILNGMSVQDAQAYSMRESAKNAAASRPGIIQNNENLRYGQGPIMNNLNSAGNMGADAIDTIKNWWHSSAGVRGASTSGVKH